MKVVASNKFTREFQKFASTHNDELRGLLEKLSSLEDRGTAHGAKRLQSEQPMFVLRHGDFRAFYTLSNNQIVLLSLARKG